MHSYYNQKKTAFSFLWLRYKANIKGWLQRCFGRVNYTCLCFSVLLIKKCYLRRRKNPEGVKALLQNELHPMYMDICLMANLGKKFLLYSMSSFCGVNTSNMSTCQLPMWGHCMPSWEKLPRVNSYKPVGAGSSTPLIAAQSTMEHTRTTATEVITRRVILISYNVMSENFWHLGAITLYREWRQILLSTSFPALSFHIFS